MCHMFMTQGKKVILLVCLHSDLSVGLMPVIWPVHKASNPAELFSATGEKYSNRLLLKSYGEEQGEISSYSETARGLNSKVADRFIKNLLFPFFPPFLFLN